MTRPARKLSPAVLDTLYKRPRLRYTLTSKGTKAFESGETKYGNLLDSLVEAIDANNKQPVSLTMWRRFHQPKKVKNNELRELVEERLISLVSRGKYGFAIEGEKA